MKTNIHLTVEMMRHHVHDLAKAFGVELVLTDQVQPDEACAMVFNGRPMVIARPVTDETSYAVVLHELGHKVSPLGTLRAQLREHPPAPGAHLREYHRWANLKLEEEYAAWDWAVHNALDWTVAMEMVRQFAVQTYEQAKDEVGMTPAQVMRYRARRFGGVQ